jgi:hypothetical protein
MKIGPAARNSFSRMLGSWLGITGSHRIRGWIEFAVGQIGVHRDQKGWLTFQPSYEGFGDKGLAQDIIVVCIRAEALFCSGVLERPDSVKIISKMTPIACLNALGRASVGTPSSVKAKSNRSASNGSRMGYDDGWRRTRVDSDAKCNPVDSIGSSTKSRVSHSERPPSARFPGDEDGSARRNIEPLQ